MPGNCRLCSAPLTKISRLPVCDRCLEAMHPIAGLVCGICGERLASPYAVSEGMGRCGACQRLEPLFAKAVAYGSYEGGLRELIHLLKYEQVRPAAGVLGRMLGEAAATVAPLLDQSQPLVIPVPLHAAKLRQRGFNQSELIARAALKSPALTTVCWPLHTAVLERSRPTESQTGLTRHQRHKIPAMSAFPVAKSCMEIILMYTISRDHRAGSSSSSNRYAHYKAIRPAGH
ncbi:MAG TPA: hypothetical protein VJP83_02420 [Terriglobales bacterium]|nr:hypothetical protein [Terriglobales bacterium]